MKNNRFFMQFYSLVLFSLTTIFHNSMLSMENEISFKKTPLYHEYQREKKLYKEQKKIEELQKIRARDEVLVTGFAMCGALYCIILPFTCYFDEHCAKNNFFYTHQEIISQIIPLITIPTCVAYKLYVKAMGKDKISSDEYPYYPWNR